MTVKTLDLGDGTTAEYKQEANPFKTPYILACEELHDELVNGFKIGRVSLRSVIAAKEGVTRLEPVSPQHFPSYVHNHDRRWDIAGKTRYLEYKNDSYPSPNWLCLEVVVNLPKHELPKTGATAEPGDKRHHDYLANARLFRSINDDNRLGLVHATLLGEDHYLSYIRFMSGRYYHSTFDTLKLAHWARRNLYRLPLTVVDHESNPDHNNLIALVPPDLYPELDAFRMTPKQDVTAEMVAINLNHPLENR